MLIRGKVRSFFNANSMTRNPYISANLQPITLQLLDPYTCLIANVPIKLSQHILQTYQLIPSFKHQGYATKLKMLNSLKRCFQEIGLVIVELPNSAFKMFKILSGTGINSLKRTQLNDKLKNKKLIKGKGNNGTIKTDLFKNGLQKISFAQFSRWILSAHQRQTVDFFLNRGRRIIIGDGWNMGKTVTSLACSFFNKSRRVLVLVPKILLTHWAWHIQQLCSHYHAKNIVDQITCLQILDFQQLQTQNSKSKVKFEHQKAQIKFKTQQFSSINPITYSLASYQYVKAEIKEDLQRLKIDTYNMLILDEPKMFDQSQKDVQNDIASERLLKRLKSIENIVICKSMSVPETRCYLSILNTKLQQPQIYARYGVLGEKMQNFHEYNQSVSKYYYHCGNDLSLKQGPVIKTVTISYDPSTNGLFLDHQCKTQAVLQYIIHVCGDKSKQYYLIFQNEQSLQYFGSKLKQLSIPTLLLSQENNKKRPYIYLATMIKIVTHFQQFPVQDPLSSICILCDTIPFNQWSPMTQQLYQLHRSSSIQYLEYCRLDSISPYKIDRIELRNPEIMIPEIDQRYYVQKVMMEGQYVASDDGRPRKDPQHYVQSDESLSNRMVDQNQQNNQQQQQHQDNGNRVHYNSEKPKQNQVMEIMDSSSGVSVGGKKGLPLVEIFVDSDQESRSRNAHRTIFLEKDKIFAQQLMLQQKQVPRIIDKVVTRNKSRKIYGQHTMETRRSSKKKKQQNSVVINQISEQSPVVRVPKQSEQSKMQQQNPISVSPCKQCIQIGSDTQLEQTKLTSPVKSSTRMPKSKAKQVLSVKLIPKISQLRSDIQ